ncbi:hypothetical protein HMI56_005155, partial [Coelomomyces lativittatus]
ILNATQIVILLFPSVAGIQPIHEKEVSLVECVFDLFYMLLWLITSSILATRGHCPKFLFLDPNSTEFKIKELLYNHHTKSQSSLTSVFDSRCTPWNLVWLFGYILALLYLISAMWGLWIRRKRNRPTVKWN